jgi:4-amino-4-deoxy-L-arabinose transferase-like glycosyltransferase
MLGGVSKRLHHLVLLVALVVMSLLMLRGYSEDSPTEDELTHMVRGIAYFRGSDTRLSYAHPPLGNAWTALPVAWDAKNPEIDKLKGWRSATASTTTKAYVDKDYGYARAQLMRSRIAGMAVGLMLVAYVYYFCLSLFGLRTALAALALLTLNPVLIAQCRYVTTDPAAMLGFSVAVGELVRYLLGARFGVVRVALGLSLAMLTKFSGVTLVPFSLLVTVVCCATGQGIFANQPLKRRLLRLAQHAAIVLAGILFCVNLAYKFNDTGMSVGEVLDRKEPSYWVSNKYPNLFERYTPLPSLPRALPLPVPYSYMFGIAGIRGHSDHGFTSYFWGEKLKKAPPSYFPVLLAIKNPPALVLLLLAAAFLFVRRRKLSLASWILTCSVATFLFVATRSNLAMGVRHVLPIIPPLSILAARAFDLLWSQSPSQPLRVALGLTLGSLPVSALTAGPDYLGYFNLFAGGRKGGHQISVYGEDWGQDRQRLAELVKARKLEPLYYVPQTAMRAQEMRYLGMRYRTLRCGTRVSDAWVAMHALTYRTHDLPRCYPYLVGRAPDLDVNDHVLLWKIPKLGDVPEAGKREAEGADALPPEER